MANTVQNWLDHIAFATEEEVRYVFRTADNKEVIPDSCNNWKKLLGERYEDVIISTEPCNDQYGLVKKEIVIEFELLATKEELNLVDE